MTNDWAAPMTPLWTQIRAWALATIERAKMYLPGMGLSLYATFLAADFPPPPPELRLECAVGGGDIFAWGWANVMRGLAPLMERLGITTAAELPGRHARRTSTR